MEIINTKDLNGQEPIDFKIITKIIQNPDPVKFSEQCKELFKTINTELLVFYGVTNNTINTPRGQAFIFIATIQYWATEIDFNTWLDEIKRDNLLIKP